MVEDDKIKLEKIINELALLMTNVEIPALYSREEQSDVVNEIKSINKKLDKDATQETMYADFLKNVKYNLKILFAMSPYNEKFRY